MSCRPPLPCECGCGVMLGQNPNGYSVRRYWSDACQRRVASARKAKAIEDREAHLQAERVKRRQRYAEKRSEKLACPSNPG